MAAPAPKAVFLQAYQAPEFAVKHTALRFELHTEYTLVHARLQMERNGSHRAPVTLFGSELELVSVMLDGQKLPEDRYQVSDETLNVQTATDSFQLEVVTRIYPQSNSSLEGLYQSRTMYCTQCEAEGFRKITYYPDRPDVLSVFDVYIEADQTLFPVLLSNGNLTESGQLPGGRHYAKWHDPYPKPCYLFALVAGDLACVDSDFTTTSGRSVAIRIYVEEKDLSKCDYAITSLKNAMRWDEQVYGREYDLDIYMVVAVDDFNMGAMENKGLNIFNTSCVLASPETTTDQAYQRVEGVIAHEYFHNWSGNRVTCRDWFQLSLKEGFTVFRDQEFSADMGSATVKRVEDVQQLRALQFAEDAGPMAHPVRPASYIEISNFYTLTVYEKGAEVVRMIRTLIGSDAFRTGSDLYFQRHDGSAATIEDFIAAMSEVSGYDFTQFMLWYSQAGTPRLHVTETYDAKRQTYTLVFEQSCPNTPDAREEDKKPFVIPVNLSLVGSRGNLALSPNETDAFRATDDCSGVFTLGQKRQSITFVGVAEKPVPALLRGFSAPVKLDFAYAEDDLLRLIEFERDGFCRWDASEKLAILAATQMLEETGDSSLQALLLGLSTLLQQSEADPAMVALMLTMPSVSYLGEQFEVVDVDNLYQVRERLLQTVAVELEGALWQTYQRCAQALKGREGFTADVFALRSLKNRCLMYLMRLAEQAYIDACWQQFCHSRVMSDEYCALQALISSINPQVEAKREEAIEIFYQKWRHEPLVMNQWFSAQAAANRPGALERVRQLLSHPAYDGHNPNKIRSVVGVFCGQNLVNFHRLDGKGYEFLTEQILYLNTKNPQIAARLVTPLSKWQRYDVTRQALMKSQLYKIEQTPGLSKDVFEVVAKSLQG